MAGDDYYGGDYLQDRPLLDQVHNEAGRQVDGHNPCDGRGDEPAERLSAYCAAGGRSPNRSAPGGRSHDR